MDHRRAVFLPRPRVDAGMAVPLHRRPGPAAAAPHGCTAESGGEGGGGASPHRGRGRATRGRSLWPPAICLSGRHPRDDSTPAGREVQYIPLFFSWPYEEGKGREGGAPPSPPPRRRCPSGGWRQRGWPVPRGAMHVYVRTAAACAGASLGREPRRAGYNSGGREALGAATRGGGGGGGGMCGGKGGHHPRRRRPRQRRLWVRRRQWRMRRRGRGGAGGEVAIFPRGGGGGRRAWRSWP